MYKVAALLSLLLVSVQAQGSSKRKYLVSEIGLKYPNKKTSRAQLFRTNDVIS